MIKKLDQRQKTKADAVDSSQTQGRKNQTDSRLPSNLPSPPAKGTTKKGLNRTGVRKNRLSSTGQRRLVKSSPKGNPSIAGKKVGKVIRAKGD